MRSATPTAAMILTTVLMAAAATAQPAPSSARAGVPDTRLVQFVLVEASLEKQPSTGNLPENVRPAIEDVRQFLPFESYRILDAALIRSDRVATTRMRGAGDAEYEVRANFGPIGEARRIRVLQFQVVRTVRLPELAQSRQGRDTAPEAPAAPRTIIQTSFEAEIGKTVVVGTSRLNGGDNALIVLFTALP